MPSPLTDGAIGALMSGERVEKPIVQMISFKKMPGTTVGPSRYRLVLSDGKHFITSAMLASQMNYHIDTGALDKYAIMSLDNYMINNMPPENTRKIIIVLALTIRIPGDTVGVMMGSPTQLAETGTGTSNTSTSGANAPSAPSAPSASKGPPASIYRRQPENVGNSNFVKEERSVQPIDMVTPYQNRWTIKAQVTNKSGIRTWSNSKGEGKLFSVEFADVSGEIRATAFKDECDKFYNVLEKDKVYFVSRAQVKMANKRFTSIKHEYELTFTPDTTVELCNEKCDGFGLQHFNFVKIDQLENTEKDALVDVIGVCKRTGDCTSITTRSTNREVMKRVFQLVDQSKKEVSLTLWAEEAENFNNNDGKVIAVRAARVSDFGGRSLSVTGSGQMLIDPETPEAKVLRIWYDREGAQSETQSISNQGWSKGGGGLTTWKTLAEAKNALGKLDERPDYFSVKAYPTFFRKDNAMYMACATPDCQKKVIDQNDGTYRCEKCCKVNTDFKWRLLLSLNIADGTDNMWVTSFQESSETILGKTCNQLAEIKDNGDAYQDVFNAASFESFIFRLRTKMETYNDEQKLKTAVVSVTPVDFSAYNKKVIADINKMLS